MLDDRSTDLGRVAATDRLDKPAGQGGSGAGGNKFEQLFGSGRIRSAKVDQPARGGDAGGFHLPFVPRLGEKGGDDFGSELFESAASPSRTQPHKPAAGRRSRLLEQGHERFLAGVAQPHWPVF